LNDNVYEVIPIPLHRKLLYHFSTATALVFLLFGAIYLFKGLPLLGGFEMTVGIIQLLNILYLYRGGDSNIAARILVAFTYLMSLIIYLAGGLGHTGFLWILFMPIFTMLIINHVESAKWLIAYSIAVIGLVLLHWSGYLTLPYDDVQIRQSLLVYMLFVYLTYYNERTKQAARRKLREQEQLMIQQSKMAAMGEMLEVIAHQWRQPLNISSLGISKIQMERELGTGDAENETRTLRQIAQQIDLLSNTIDDFRSFFKKDKEKQRVLLSSVINDVNTLLGGTLAHNGITCAVTHHAAISVELFANELKQVLLNIVNNAKDAIVLNHPERKEISIETFAESSQAVIRICDSGGGIDQKILERIFEPYFTTKAELQGTGIGLYLSKIIIEKHLKGTITASNDADGACFTVRLPL